MLFISYLERHKDDLTYITNRYPVGPVKGFETTGVLDPASGTRFTLGKTGELYRERYWHSSMLEAVARLRTFFEPRRRSLVTVAVAWVLAQSGITSAVLGASKPEQLDASLAAVNLTLDEEERAACDLAWYGIPRTAPTR